MKQMIAIDGNSLLFRAFYALPDMRSADGTPTGGLHGFLSMLLKLLERNPDYLAVAFDVHVPTFRHEEYAEYKAGRRPTPPDLIRQFPLLREVLSAMGIAVCECPRYEADDILGTFSRRCGRAGIRSLLVTGDRDALQLIDETTSVLLTRKGITETVEYDPETLFADYGLNPDRMRDLKGLMGDNSDNIPGIPGVGEKTALKLLAEYGTLEGVLAGADRIPGKLGEKIRDNAESARMSYRIGTICTEAPLELDIEDCAFRPEKLRDAREVLNRLGLRSIWNRIAAEQDGPETAAAETAERVAVTDPEALKGILLAHRDAGRLALELGNGLAFAFDEKTCYVLEQGTDLFSAGIPLRDALEGLRPFLTREDLVLTVFDAKHLMHMAAPYGISLSCRIDDLMLFDYLINALQPSDTVRALADRLSAPSCDPAAYFGFSDRMRKMLSEMGMEKLYSGMELPLTGILFSMEQSGFRLDREMLESLQGKLADRIRELEQGIYDAAGETFNILSSKQLGTVLFEHLGLPKGKKTKTGYSTDADTLENLADRHPAVPLIQAYRFLTKLKSTFLDGLLGAMDPKTERVHTRFNQCVTATGRISSTEPNLQNIPVRTELGKEIRRAFIASEGRLLVGADYSQIELRLLAAISGDEGMIRAFCSGEDIHRRTASEVFGVPFEDVTGEQRSAAKAVNFGIVYGISDFGLARNLSIPVRQAGEYIRMYFERYPGVKAYLEQSVEDARKKGYAETLFGRRRPLPELSSSNYNTRSFGERVAMNMPIQGTAADVIKLAMVSSVRRLLEENRNAELLLQVHDELLFDTPEAEVPAVMETVKDCMEHVLDLPVPLIAEVRCGPSWYDTK